MKRLNISEISDFDDHASDIEVLIKNSDHKFVLILPLQCINKTVSYRDIAEDYLVAIRRHYFFHRVPIHAETVV